MSTDEYTVWETVWTVWKMRDGELVSTGKNFATEAEAVAVADGLSRTETRVVSSRRVVDTPLPDHLAVDWDTIETGFHEYAADLTRQELEGAAKARPPSRPSSRIGRSA